GKPRYSFRADRLDQRAITLSLKDGGFLANLLAVWAFPHRFPLNYDFGTLAGGLGCFPLHDGR
ncbi:hypothetical protein CWB66_17895, partial [Pseudoalteromonas sp. S558]